LYRFSKLVRLESLLNVKEKQKFTLKHIGPLFTYAAPLAFVVGLSISMEAYLDIKRILRDRQVNGEKYTRLTFNGLEEIEASEIKVGHFIRIETNRRVCFNNGNL
jgi:phospholipid-translocating ATPase